MAIYILLKKMVTNKFAIFVKPPLFIKSNIFFRPLKPTRCVSFWTNSIHMACHIAVFIDFDILKSVFDKFDKNSPSWQFLPNNFFTFLPIMTCFWELHLANSCAITPRNCEHLSTHLVYTFLSLFCFLLRTLCVGKFASSNFSSANFRFALAILYLLD